MLRWIARSRILVKPALGSRLHTERLSSDVPTTVPRLSRSSDVLESPSSSDLTLSRISNRLDDRVNRSATQSDYQGSTGQDATSQTMQTRSNRKSITSLFFVDFRLHAFGVICLGPLFRRCSDIVSDVRQQISFILVHLVLLSGRQMVDELEPAVVLLQTPRALVLPKHNTLLEYDLHKQCTDGCECPTTVHRCLRLCTTYA